MYEVQPATEEMPSVIDQNKINRHKAYHGVHFRTGKYMTEKDRPRIKYKPKDVEYD